jgi:hypothetical protein
MVETKLEAMKQFIAKMQSIRSQPDPSGEDPAAALDDGAEILAPFLSNSDRDLQAVRIILEGIAVAYIVPIVRPLLQMQRLLSVVPGLKGMSFEESKQRYISKLVQARQDLLSKLDPGKDIRIDIIRPKVEATYATSTQVSIRIKVALTLRDGRDEYPARRMNVRLMIADPEVEIVEVAPSFQFEGTGSRKTKVSETTKTSLTRKDTDKIGGEVGGPGAKISSELAVESTVGDEETKGTESEFNSEDIEYSVISLAIGGEAEWALLKMPKQPLKGGQNFLVTALVPNKVASLTLTVRARPDLEHYGPLVGVLTRTVPKADWLHTSNETT